MKLGRTQKMLSPLPWGLHCITSLIPGQAPSHNPVPICPHFPLEGCSRASCHQDKKPPSNFWINYIHAHYLPWIFLLALFHILNHFLSVMCSSSPAVFYGPGCHSAFLRLVTLQTSFVRQQSPSFLTWDWSATTPSFCSFSPASGSTWIHLSRSGVEVNVASSTGYLALSGPRPLKSRPITAFLVFLV